MSAIVLRHLTFVGTKPRATVDFDASITVISGASDTGKSFIGESIDFVLGAGKLRGIPHSEGYDTVLLGLTLNGEILTFARPLSGKRVTLYRGDVRSSDLPLHPIAVLSATHSAKSDNNISSYLLSRIGFGSRSVRKNGRDVTVSLSFRDLAHLCIIGELKMQSEYAPPFNGQRQDTTKEISVLKAVLESHDDSLLEPIPEQAELRRTARGQAELVQSLIEDARSRVDATATRESLLDQLARLNRSMSAEMESSDSMRDELARLAETGDALHREARVIQASLNDVSEHGARFALLGRQYASDLERVEMVAEVGSLLGYFTPGVCPFCGASEEHQPSAELHTDSTEFAEAVVRERTRTLTVQADLDQALVDLEITKGELQSRLDEVQAERQEIDAGIRLAEERLVPAHGALQQLTAAKSEVERQLGVVEEIERLEEVVSRLDLNPDPMPLTPPPQAAGSTARLLGDYIKERLDAWGFAGADRVYFDRNAHDVYAGDQLRSTHGKGVRAVLHAAFTISLAQICLDYGLPHPGFVVLDSPLVTYRDPGAVDESGLLTGDFVTAFYKDVHDNFSGQLVILENRTPPSDLYSAAQAIEFTDLQDEGRAGLLPPLDS